MVAVLSHELKLPDGKWIVIFNTQNGTGGGGPSEPGLALGSAGSAVRKS
jgi:hypothetical protein